MKGTSLYLRKMINDPIGYPLLVLRKLFIQPFTYRKGNEYDVERYWSDRFKKYGLSLRGPGDEGLSEKANEDLYKKDSESFLTCIGSEIPAMKNSRVLEIGCGNGFYTQMLHELGINDVTCIDITDVLFPEFKIRFPNYRFIKTDITQEEIHGDFDYILFMDVLEHIVVPEKFGFCIKNIERHLAPNGRLILTPIYQETEKVSFYVCKWSLADIECQMNHNLNVLKRIPHRYSEIILAGVDVNSQT